MTISFYKITDPPNKINKTITNPLTITGEVREDTIDQFEPEILVDTNITGYNYMYILEWDKYYFINGCENPRNGLYKVNKAHIDVLMTYASDILSQRCIIDKTEDTNLKNEYIDDGSVVVTSKMNVTKLEFDNGFNSDQYTNVLITAGAGGSSSGAGGS